MKVGVIWLGYVGFPLACCIARNESYEVVWLDIDKKKISLIRSGISPVEDDQAQEDYTKKQFAVSDDTSILSDVDIAIVCVPTPITDGFLPNLGPVLWAVKTITDSCKRWVDVIIESTINPGVCNEQIVPVFTAKWWELNKDYTLSHCPERINPGDKKWNVYNIARCVGSSNNDALTRIKAFYESILDADVIAMKDIRHAEATKIIENTFRDINIAYVNELAKSFDAMWLDITEVIKWAKTKPFAFMAHYPSCGVGGHCIPVDPYYLIEKAKSIGFDHKYLSLAREINNSMPVYTVSKLIKQLNCIQLSMSAVDVAVLWLSYKADIGDTRESPSFEIIQELKNRDANVMTYDPFVVDQCSHTSLESILGDADCIIIATNHAEFVENITPSLLEKYSISCIVDGKNCLEASWFQDSSVNYTWIWK